MNKGKVVRIGGASGFWGDSSVGAPQLVHSGQVDYLVFDYLAELTMSILASARLKKPDMGYATDFVTVAMKSVLKDVVAKGIRVVSNAGGVNPQGCADALQALAAEQGIALKIAVVSGDDVMQLLPQLRASEPPVAELQAARPCPPRCSRPTPTWAPGRSRRRWMRARRSSSRVAAWTPLSRWAS